jgi:hypothetical protein
MPNAKMLVIEDYKPGLTKPDVDGLREKLTELPDFAEAELTPKGRSSVYVSVPARNENERDRLKALINEKIDGWSVIEEQSYGLPKTF